MNLVFSTDEIPAAKRYDAWRVALCDHYVNVDTVSDVRDDYQGFIKEAKFGVVTMTDTLLSPQHITRQRSHLARIDKDCFYVALIQKGSQQGEQRGQSLANGTGSAALFCASEPYKLHNEAPYRAIYLEFPRDEFASRCTGRQPPQTATINTAVGMGRVVAELCMSMVLESDSLLSKTRDRLGHQVLDLFAIAIDASPGDVPIIETAVQSARIRQVKAYIDANLGNPLLNPDRVARANQMSVRALHYLFKSSEMSVSDYIWDRRLEKCRAELETLMGRRRSVTEIALAAGFNSMSHFSSVFRRRYGTTPSDTRASALA